MNSNAISVEKIRKVGAGNLRAFADVKIGDIVIRDFRIIQQPNQKPWVSSPQRTYKSENGEMRYANTIELSNELKTKVQLAVLTAFDNPVFENSPNKETKDG